MTRADALRLNIAVDNSQAIPALAQTERAIANTATVATRGGTAIESAFGGINGAFLRFGAASAVLGIAVAGLNRFAETADDIGDVTRSFDVLASRSGITADVLTDLRKATDGEATAMQLMQTANLAMQAGLPLTNAKLIEMADIATKLGASVGVDAAEAFDNFTTAIVRMSDRQLRAMGIMVDAEDAAKKYASAHHLTVEALTEAERQQAFMNEAMEKGAVAAKGLGAEMPSLSGWFKAVGSAAKNAGADVLRFFDNLPAEFTGAAQQKRLDDFLKGQQALGSPAPTAAAGLDPRVAAEWSRSMDALAKHYTKMAEQSERAATAAFNEKMARQESLAVVAKLNQLLAVQEGVNGGALRGGLPNPPIDNSDPLSQSILGFDPAADLERYAQFTSDMLAMNLAYQQQFNAIEQAAADERDQIHFREQAAKVAAWSGFAADSMGILGMLFEHNKKIAKAEAIISGLAGAAKALEIYGPTPWGYAAAATSVAFGIARASQIGSVSIGGGGGAGGIGSFGSLSSVGTRPLAGNAERDVNVFVFLDGELLTGAAARMVGEQIARDARRTGRAN